MTSILITLNALVLGYATYRLSKVILARRRRIAELKQMRLEVEFMKPLFVELTAEILACVATGDWKGYEKTRVRYNQLSYRWKREVTDKLKH